jgi:hypothetical protein
LCGRKNLPTDRQRLAVLRERMRRRRHAWQDYCDGKDLHRFLPDLMRGSGGIFASPPKQFVGRAATPEGCLCRHQAAHYEGVHYTAGQHSAGLLVLQFEFLFAMSAARRKAAIASNSTEKCSASPWYTSIVPVGCPFVWRKVIRKCGVQPPAPLRGYSIVRHCRKW